MYAAWKIPAATYPLPADVGHRHSQWFSTIEMLPSSDTIGGYSFGLPIAIAACVGASDFISSHRFKFQSVLLDFRHSSPGSLRFFLHRLRYCI